MENTISSGTEESQILDEVETAIGDQRNMEYGILKALVANPERYKEMNQVYNTEWIDRAYQMVAEIMECDDAKAKMYLMKVDDIEDKDKREKVEGVIADSKLYAKDVVNAKNVEYAKKLIAIFLEINDTKKKLILEKQKKIDRAEGKVVCGDLYEHQHQGWLVEVITKCPDNFYIKPINNCPDDILKVWGKEKFLLNFKLKTTNFGAAANA